MIPEKICISAQPNAITLIRSKRGSSALNVFNVNPRVSINKQRKNSNLELEYGDQSSVETQNHNLLKNIYAFIKNQNNNVDESSESIAIDENEDNMANFEIGKNYKEYFPANNLETILASIKTRTLYSTIRIFPKRRKRQFDSDKNGKVNNFMWGKEAKAADEKNYKLT